MHATADRPDEVDLADRARARDIQDTVDVLDRSAEERDGVIDVDPAHPLLARPQPPAEEEADGEREVPDELRVPSQDVALPELGDPDAEALRPAGLVLDGLRDAGEELLAHRARLGPGSRVVPVGGFGIGVDARDDNEARRTPVGWKPCQRIDDRVGSHHGDCR